MSASNQQKKDIKITEEYLPHLVNGEYQCLPLDFHLCHSDLTSAHRGANCCVVHGRFPQQSISEDDFHVIYKAVDVLRDIDAAGWIEDEAHAYAALRDLQGRVIPTLYGFHDLWGILHVLVLQPVGETIQEDDEIDEMLRVKMREALRCIHEAGFVHGDVARRNFCRTDSGDVFLVDLERCRAAENLCQMEDEMREVDRL